ncbi:DNA polymerase III subunit gamma/tau [Lichenicoccus sp.]|uniref:DNA polymerase III subunit gamma/tau n=1 Tax=Lichenicoccus sp. TaxID=2781899 RepID=UPI003D0F3551
MSQDFDLSPEALPPADGPGLFGDPAPPAAPYRVLARVWRPTRFEELIGQDAMVRILRRAFALGRVAHGFMLTGVRGTGKTTTARIIARALNCIGPDGSGGPTADPCGVCANCTAILADRHPDVLEMDAASRTGVDDVREIIEATRFRPMQARMKVFIIDEVHMLSRNAFNALLKTLEEPPAQVTFIFATTELRKVPVTVLSRCQRFDLRRVSQSELASHFGAIAAKEGAAISADALALIARAADGSVRDGLSLLDQAIALGEDGPGAEIDAAMVAGMLGQADRGVVFDLLEAVTQGRADLALGITEQAHARGADLGLMLADLLELIHTVSRLKTLPALRDTRDLPEAERVRGAELADRLSVPSLARLWQMLLKGIGEVEVAPDRADAAEMVLIRLCHVRDMPTPGDLVRRLVDAPAPETPSRPEPPADVQPADPKPIAPVLSGWRDVVAHVATCREASLHGHLRHSVHLVRFAPPIIELRLQPQAPRDLAQRLAAILSDATGTRWTIAVSRAPGEPTLAEQSETMEASGRTRAEAHPLVQAILSTFPGAQVGRLHDRRLDEYGLLPQAAPDLAFDQNELPEDD